MRTPREAVAALALIALIAAPVLAMPRPEREPLAWTVVPRPGPSVGLVARDRDRAVAPRPVPTLRPLRPVVRVPEPRLIIVKAHPRALEPSRRDARTVTGTASRMGPGFGRSYLALPEGPGHRVTICGAGGCHTMTSTDAGPDKAMQRAGRVADLNDAIWALVCGIPLSAGLCRVSVAYL